MVVYHIYYSAHCFFHLTVYVRDISVAIHGELPFYYRYLTLHWMPVS